MWAPREVCGEEVLRSDRFGPAVVGLIRSRIVLPAWSFGLGEKKLELVVLHEREHVRARDPLLLAAGLMLAALSPWNPAVWWLLARLRLAVEGDCDRRVLARGTSARRYARLLLTVAAGCRRTPEPVPALIRGGHSAIERRLMMIRTSTRKPRIRASILTGAAGLGLFALACDTPLPQSPSELEPATRSRAVVVAEALADAEVGVVRKAGGVYVAEDGTYLVRPAEWQADPKAGVLYVDEDGIFQALDDPAAKARILRTLEQHAVELEKLVDKLEERPRSSEITEEKILQDLRLRLEAVRERLGSR